MERLRRVKALYDRVNQLEAQQQGSLFNGINIGDDYQSCIFLNIGKTDNSTNEFLRDLQNEADDDGATL
ncbi:hypothetical protein [Facilibium subflavum]|uniref:hypothetical protein n=1 Tax=Facilibium subflavum TaxID=2219058 RepID=UPI000E650F19|nr:hypothetical protein [Facilibium subflavum]